MTYTPYEPKWNIFYPDQESSYREESGAQYANPIELYDEFSNAVNPNPYLTGTAAESGLKAFDFVIKDTSTYANGFRKCDEFYTGIDLYQIQIQTINPRSEIEWDNFMEYVIGDSIVVQQIPFHWIKPPQPTWDRSTPTMEIIAPLSSSQWWQNKTPSIGALYNPQLSDQQRPQIGDKMMTIAPGKLQEGDQFVSETLQGNDAVFISTEKRDMGEWVLAEYRGPPNRKSYLLGLHLANLKEKILTKPKPQFARLMHWATWIRTLLTKSVKGLLEWIMPDPSKPKFDTAFLDAPRTYHPIIKTIPKEPGLMITLLYEEEWVLTPERYFTMIDGRLAHITNTEPKKLDVYKRVSDMPLRVKYIGKKLIQCSKPEVITMKVKKIEKKPMDDYLADLDAMFTDWDSKPKTEMKKQ